MDCTDLYLDLETISLSFKHKQKRYGKQKAKKCEQYAQKLKIS